MSNFSSLKNVPPALRDLTAEKAWKKLREPFPIAILASIGVHGLLWFGLPLLSSSATKPPEQRTLNVIELSPLEQQARLPQTSSLVQPIPTQPKSSGSSNAGIPMVPLDSPIPTTDPFYKIPDYSTSQSTTDYSSIIKRSASKSKSKTQTKETEKQETQTETEPQNQEETASDETSTNSEDLIGTDGKPLNKGRDSQENLALQQSFAFNTTGTTEQDYQNNAAIAANQIAEKYNIRDWEKPISTRAAYPSQACQFQHEGKPVQGVTGLVVVMQPDGSLGDTALMVKSSGFKGLDEAAQKYVEKQWSEIVKQNKIEPERKPKAYPLAITVEPAEGDCAAQKPAA